MHFGALSVSICVDVHRTSLDVKARCVAFRFGMKNQIGFALVLGMESNRCEPFLGGSRNSV